MPCGVACLTYLECRHNYLLKLGCTNWVCNAAQEATCPSYRRLLMLKVEHKNRCRSCTQQVLAANTKARWKNYQRIYEERAKSKKILWDIRCTLLRCMERTIDMREIRHTAQGNLVLHEAAYAYHWTERYGRTMWGFCCPQDNSVPRRKFEIGLQNFRNLLGKMNGRLVVRIDATKEDPEELKMWFTPSVSNNEAPAIEPESPIQPKVEEPQSQPQSPRLPLELEQRTRPTLALRPKRLCGSAGKCPTRSQRQNRVKILAALKVITSRQVWLQTEQQGKPIPELEPSTEEAVVERTILAS